MLIPISILKKVLDNKLGVNSWSQYETETLILELDLPFSNLLYDKIAVLKTIDNNTDLFFEDVIFNIYATSVINNIPADFEFLPHLTSLEMAFSIIEISRVLGVELHNLPEFGIGTTTYIRNMLIDEGYSEVISPFDIVSIGALPKGQTSKDTIDKANAIKEYIHAMYNQSAD